MLYLVERAKEGVRIWATLAMLLPFEILGSLVTVLQMIAVRYARP